MFYMKWLHILPLVCLICLCHLSRSQPGNTRQSPEAAQSPSARLRQPHEAALQQLTGQYAAAAASEKQSLREEAKSVIYVLFDLKIQQLEQDASALRQQLAELEQQPGSAQRSSELQRLRSTLSEVETALKFRRENRDAIVLKRLNELFPQE